MLKIFSVKTNCRKILYEESLKNLKTTSVLFIAHQNNVTST